MKRSKLSKVSCRLLSVMMCIMVMITSINVNALIVRAEGETDPSKIGSTSSSVTATFTSTNISGEYHEYIVEVSNNLSEGIGGWLIDVPLSGAYDVQDWSGWSSITAYRTDSHIYIVPNTSKYDGKIAAGGKAGSSSDNDSNFKFCYKAGTNISSYTVYYVGSSKSQSEFNSVIEAATAPSAPSGGGGGGGGSITPGTPVADSTTELNKEDVQYNYAKLLQESLYFYDANMCGDIDGVCAVNWRQSCHAADKTATYKGKTIDVSGGFHDAGDYEKFGLPQGYSAAVLGIGYYEFKEAYEELGQAEHLKTITDYFCEYFKKCTVVEDGKAIAFCYQIGDGTSHNEWASPQNDKGNRGAYLADSSNPATDQVSIAAAALAINYENFGDEDDLKYAKLLFDMAMENPKAAKNSDGGDFYTSSGYKDEYSLAAAWLYKVTSEAKYQTAYNEYASGLSLGGWPAWDDNGAYAVFYGAGNKDALATAASTNINACTSIDNGYAYLAQWGSARYNCNMQLLGLIHDKYSETKCYTDWATGQMNFLLGNNNLDACFVIGYNKYSSKNPHHRPISTYKSSNSGTSTVLVGALVGGIGDGQTYHDVETDYTCNEVAIDYNAAFVGAAAALYLAHKDDADSVNTLATKDELEKLGVSVYYGESSGKKAQSMTATIDKDSIDIGGTATITATGVGTITYKSSNVAVATVSDTGIVTGVSAGSAIITVAAAGDETYNKDSKKINITVKSGEKPDDPPAPGKKNQTLNVSIDESNLYIGETAQINAEGKGEITYESGAADIATVSSTGTVSAVKVGTAYITVKASGNEEYNSASEIISVKVLDKDEPKPDPAPEPDPEKKTQTLTVSVSKESIEIGEKVTITAEGKGTISFTSNNNEIATVSDSGVITGVSEGTAYITVKASGNEEYNSATKIVSIKVVKAEDPAPEPSDENKTYVITFDACGGTVSEATREIKYGEEYKKLPVPVKAGFEFDGWYTGKDAGSYIDAEGKYSYKTDMTFYAQYNPITLFKGQKYDITPLFEDYMKANPGKYKVVIEREDGKASCKKAKGRFIVTAKKEGSVNAVLMVKNGKKWIKAEGAESFEIDVVKFLFNRISMYTDDDSYDIFDAMTIDSTIPSPLYNEFTIVAKTSKTKPVISVENGEIKPLKKGKALVNIYVKRGNISKKITVKVTVKNPE